MSLEHAFARALADHPESRLAVRVKKSLRHVHRNLERPVDAPESRVLRDLGYRFEQLGRSWSSFRLGGCPWVGPIERLRDDWHELRDETQRAGLGHEEHALLGRMARGLELRGEELDCRGRSYLLGVIKSMPTDRAEFCQLTGIRLFSPLTLFVEVIHDLEDHSLAERVAFRDLLANLSEPQASTSGAPSMEALTLALSQSPDESFPAG